MNGVELLYTRLSLNLSQMIFTYEFSFNKIFITADGINQNVDILSNGRSTIFINQISQYLYKCNSVFSSDCGILFLLYVFRLKLKRWFRPWLADKMLLAMKNIYKSIANSFLFTIFDNYVGSVDSKCYLDCSLATRAIYHNVEVLWT